VILRKIGRGLMWLCSLPPEEPVKENRLKAVALEPAGDGRILMIRSFSDGTFRRDVCEPHEVEEVIESWTTGTRTSRIGAAGLNA
jgi:hypothetical protein